MIDFNYLRRICAERIREWMGKPNGNDLVTVLFSTTELAGETGEACNEAKKLARTMLGVKGGSTDVSKLADEIADVVICADNLAQCFNIDLGAAVVAKFNKTSDKHGFTARMGLLSHGAARIARERERQINQEGWTPLHDEKHDRGELALAAASYAAAAAGQVKFGRTHMGDIEPPRQWPWAAVWWKLSDDPIRTLEKAGALIAAEIDRLQSKRGGAS